MLDCLKDLIFPPRCVLCRGFISRKANGICSKCAKTLPWLYESARHSDGEFFDDCVSPLKYEDNVRSAILRYKFSGKRVYSPVFGRLLCSCIGEEYPDQFDVITWVPISRKRLRKRGYDQSQLLAEYAAGVFGLPCMKLLNKNRDNPAQSSIRTAAERKGNVLGVYDKVGEDIAGKRILLVDDIVTTGSTLGEAARILAMAGADTVLCATLAKSQLRSKKK